MEVFTGGKKFVKFDGCNDEACHNNFEIINYFGFFFTKTKLMNKDVSTFAGEHLMINKTSVLI